MASWIAKDEVALNNWLAKLPAGRLGRPDDVASAIAFLASSDADYIHGETLVVDGGGSA